MRLPTATCLLLLLFVPAVPVRAGPENEVSSVLLAEGTRFATPAYVRWGEAPGPTVVVVGGMHGDERAGWRAAGHVRHWPIVSGKLVVIPRANRLGVEQGRRTVPAEKAFDLNRRFPSDSDEPVAGPISASIWKLLREHPPDWVLDLHESRNYRFRSTKTRKYLGNSLICRSNDETLCVAGLMTGAANRLTPQAGRKWVALKSPIEGSLARAAADRLGAHAIIAETSRKDFLAIRIRQHRVLVHRLLRELGMLPEGFSPYTVFPEERSEEEVRVALFNSYGTGSSSAYKVERCLGTPGIAPRRITATEIIAGALSQYDVVVFPGGTGSGSANTLGKSGRAEVRRFVKEGGGYLGICAGAYLGTTHYSWSLGLVDAKVLDTRHWARGKGMVTVKLTAAGRRLFDETAPAGGIYYAQGPILARGGRRGVPDYEVLATYVTGIAKNGAPKGVMPGTAALVRGRYGKGRALLASPHPESTSGRLGWVPRAIDWLAGGR